tara:strand:+ start:431 stop:1570 length:1140 start_codon:yes stop_codon:yes gene_type:complete
MSDLFDSIVDSSTYAGPSGGSPGPNPIQSTPLYPVHLVPQMDYGVLDEDLSENDSWNRNMVTASNAHRRSRRPADKKVFEAKIYYDWLKENYPNAYKQANETYGGGDGKVSDRFEADQMMKGHSEFYGAGIFGKGGFAEENIYEFMPENRSRLLSEAAIPLETDGVFKRREEYQTEDTSNFSEFPYSPGPVIENKDRTLIPIDHEEYTKEYNKNKGMMHANWVRGILESTGRLPGREYFQALEQLAPNMTAEDYPKWMQDVNFHLENSGYVIPTRQTAMVSPGKEFNQATWTFRDKPKQMETWFGYPPEYLAEGQKPIPQRGAWPHAQAQIIMPGFENTNPLLERILSDPLDNIRPSHPPVKDMSYILNPVFSWEKQNE